MRGKYRGKRIDNGEWIYGWYHELDHANHKGKAYIIPRSASALYSFKVDPATVGQYTGLKDPEGTEVYDGDNLEVTSRLSGMKYQYTVGFDEKNARYMTENANGRTQELVSITIERGGLVIGNRWDTPEGRT